MVETTEFEDYDAFAQKWRGPEEPNETETRLLWHLLGQLDPGEVLFRVTESFNDLGDNGSVFVGTIEEETEEAIRFTDIASALKIAEHAYHIEKLGTETNYHAPSGWVDERLSEHRAAFRNRGTLDMKRIPKDEIEKIVRKQR